MKREIKAIAQKEVPRTPVGNRCARVGQNVMEQIMKKAKRGGPEGLAGSRKAKAKEQENTAFTERIGALREGDDGNSDARPCVFSPL